MTTARSKVVRTSPTLPPSASSASTMALAQDRYADIVEDGGDRRMRLVDGDPHRRHLGEPCEQCLGGNGGGGLDQPEALTGKRAGRGIDDRRVGHGVGELVARAGAGKIDGELEIDDEALSDLFLMRHHAVMGMDEE